MGPEATRLAQALTASSPELAPLAAGMGDVARSLAEWWRTNHLPWFTDHGPQHSRRVAETSLRLAELLDGGSPVPFTLLERYVLWAAAMLHDVGMQDLQHTSSELGSLSPEDYARVRREHPRRSEQVIVAGRTEFGLPDDPSLASLVAAVAGAHGTETYLESVGGFPESRYALGQPVRVGMLCGALLLADELDLDYGRVTPPSGKVILPTVSLAHFFKHESVEAAQVELDEKGRVEIVIRFAFAPGLPAGARNDVIDWVTRKIRAQIGMVEEQLCSGLRRPEPFSRIIRVEQREDPGRRMPTALVLAHIREEVAASELVNHQQCTARVLDAILEGGVVLVEAGTDDSQAAQDLLALVAARVQVYGWEVLEAHIGSIAGAGRAADILSVWTRQGSGSGSGQDREALWALVESRIGSSQEPILLVAHGMALVDRAEREWLAGKVQASRAAGARVALAFEVSPADVTTVPATRISVGGVEPTEVRRFLERLMPAEFAGRFATVAVGYDTVKLVHQTALLDLLGGA